MNNSAKLYKIRMHSHWEYPRTFRKSKVEIHELVRGYKR